jgi:hypothetical protein
VRELNLEDHTVVCSALIDRIFGDAGPAPEWTYDTFLQRVLPEDRERVHALIHQAWSVRESGLRVPDSAAGWGDSLAACARTNGRIIRVNGTSSSGRRGYHRAETFGVGADGRVKPISETWRIPFRPWSC